MGRGRECLYLNRPFLIDRIRQLDLKMWWVAEQMSVSRITLSRWVGGQVQYAAPENVERLAELLECSVSDLTVGNPDSVDPSQSEKRKAAQLMVEQDLLRALGKEGKWDLLEALVNAMPMRDLAPAQRLEMHILLSQSLIQQCRFEESTVPGRRALRLATELGDRVSLARAHTSLGIAFGRLSRSKEADEHFTKCREITNIPIAIRARTLANYVQFLLHHGRNGEGDALISEILESLPDDYPLIDRAWIVHSKARALAGMNQIPEAYALGKRCLDLARAAGDRNHEVHILLMLADLAAYQMLVGEMGEWLVTAEAIAHEVKYKDDMLAFVRAKHCRLNGDLAEAESRLDTLLERHGKDSAWYSDLKMERIRWLCQADRESDALATLAALLDLHRSCGEASRAKYVEGQFSELMPKLNRKN